MDCADNRGLSPAFLAPHQGNKEQLRPADLLFSDESGEFSKMERLEAVISWHGS
jgi:hypothetical protein